MSRSTWGSGICHTYNPPAAVEPGVTGQFYALLGHKEKVLDPMRFQGFNIYLHDSGNYHLGSNKDLSSSPGQFWPGWEMGRIGLSDVFFLAKDFEWEGSFQVEEKTLINKADNPCSEVNLLDFDQNCKCNCCRTLTTVSEVVFSPGWRPLLAVTSTGSQLPPTTPLCR